MQSLLKRLHQFLDDWGVVQLLLPFVPAHDLLVGLGTTSQQWSKLVTSCEYDVPIWRRRLARWELPSLEAVCIAQHGGSIVASNWREAYKLLAWAAFFWDETLSSTELVCGNGGRLGSTIVSKRHPYPDVSFAFARGGFSGGIVCWRVLIREMGDELRVGVTDDRAALLRQDLPGLSYENPHIWCYSDGSTVRHAFAGGRRLPQRLRRWDRGDVVTVMLNFEARKLCFFVNGEGACQLDGADFPSSDRPLFPVAVLDDRDDQIELLPLDATSFSSEWSRLLARELI